CGSVTLGKTVDRSILGCLNDIIYQIKFFVAAHPERQEGTLDVGKLTLQLNRNPWVKAQYPFAIDAMQELMRQRLNWDGTFDR
ncbi:MAG: hypothetical protein MUF49_17205, partial [Oculatellaceae cyanobacterium Prado106]|nr:hypothetical protein [Oculatellaceae cyanobacterium Prado106]